MPEYIATIAGTAEQTTFHADDDHAALSEAQTWWQRRTRRPEWHSPDPTPRPTITIPKDVSIVIYQVLGNSGDRRFVSRTRYVDK